MSYRKMLAAGMLVVLGAMSTGYAADAAKPADKAAAKPAAKPAAAPAAPAKPEPMKPEFLTNIAEASPTQAKAKPAKARKLLVYTVASGFVHKSIPYGAEAVRIWGEKTGAYTATVTDDPAAFEPDSLKQYDAVCFMNTTGDFLVRSKTGTEEQKKQDQERREQRKKALADFISSGHGYVGFHAASDAYYKWEDYGKMVGGYFAGHPWGSGETVGVRIEDSSNPLLGVFKAQGFKIKDEIYQFKDPYSRANLRVLLSLDPKTTDMNKDSKKMRADHDFPIAWVKTFGSGRVFYSSLGHNEHVFWDKAVAQFYVDGIQYALGDVKDVPTESLAAPTALRLDEHLQQLASEPCADCASGKAKLAVSSN